MTRMSGIIPFTQDKRMMAVIEPENNMEHNINATKYSVEVSGEQS
jgi:hypothetical protein